MNDRQKNLLPPIVVDYIEKMCNKRESNFQRETYCQILERIRDASNEAITKYKNEQKHKKLARK